LEQEQTLHQPVLDNGMQVAIRSHGVIVTTTALETVGGEMVGSPEMVTGARDRLLMILLVLRMFEVTGTVTVTKGPTVMTVVVEDVHVRGPGHHIKAVGETMHLARSKEGVRVRENCQLVMIIRRNAGG
jgi:hypothetical protein